MIEIAAVPPLPYATEPIASWWRQSVITRMAAANDRARIRHERRSSPGDIPNGASVSEAPYAIWLIYSTECAIRQRAGDLAFVRLRLHVNQAPQNVKRPTLL